MSDNSVWGTGEFREAGRFQDGLAARAEKKALLWLARRVPGRVTSDHMTLLGLLSLFACGVLYAASRRHAWLLLVVNLGLALNWLGDSLDGALARYRKAERPRFGYYADRLADTFGVLGMFAGLGLSGLISPLTAAGFLIAHYLVTIESVLAAYSTGRSRISWGPIGGTELRVLLILANVFVMFKPRFTVGGGSVLVFDVIGIGAAALLFLRAVTAGVRGTRELAQAEGWAPSASRPRHSSPPDRSEAS